MPGLRERCVVRVWCGAVAQLGERLVRNEEVSGSIPLSSTKESIASREDPASIRGCTSAQRRTQSGYPNLTISFLMLAAISRYLRCNSRSFRSSPEVSGGL